MLFVDRKPNGLRARVQASDKTPANKLYAECLNDALSLGLFQVFSADVLVEAGYHQEMVQSVLDELVDAGGLLVLHGTNGTPNGTPSRYTRPHRRGIVLHHLIPPPSLDHAASKIWDKECKLATGTSVTDQQVLLKRALLNVLRQPFSDMMLANAFYVLVVLASVARFDLAEIVQFHLSVYLDQGKEIEETEAPTSLLLAHDTETGELSCRVCGIPVGNATNESLASP